MNKHYSYNPALRDFARANRNDATKAEACLWKFVLKASKTGYKFNRQRPILNFIADFMCVKLKLIIEVDGYTHLNEETIRKDQIKQKALESIGYRVLRFKDGDVLKNIDLVHKEIMDVIQELNFTSPVASATPPPKEGDNFFDSGDFPPF